MIIKKSFIKIKTSFILLISFVILNSLFHSANLLAQGDLIVFPKRVVFEGNQKLHILNLANTGEKEAKYSISFVQIRMKEDGGFENISEPDPGQYFADPHLRIFPRSVTLAAKESQVIKIQLRAKKRLNDGEYRSHIYIRSIPDQDPLSIEKQESTYDSTAVVVSLTPIYGITLPVIIRVGESTTEVNLSNLLFEMINDSIPTISLTINRSGNMSVYGDIEVKHISPKNIVTQIGIVQGIAVYTPNLLRKCLFQLNKIDNVDYHNGKLLITYSTQREDKNTKSVTAELRLE